MNSILDAPMTQERKLEYAGFWIRVVAYIIDGIALSIIYLIVGAVGVTAAIAADQLWLLVLLYVGFIVGVYAYFALMESSERQATLGKMAVGIKVGNERGERITTMNSLGRTLGKILSTIILYIGYIMVGFDERKQGLHDKLANTVVYYSR